MSDLTTQTPAQQQQYYSNDAQGNNGLVSRSVDSHDMDGSTLPLFLQQPQASITDASLPTVMSVVAGLDDQITSTGNGTTENSQEAGSPYGTGRCAAYREDRNGTESPIVQGDPMDAHNGDGVKAPPQKGLKEDYLDVFSELMTGSEHEIAFLTRHFSEVLGPWYVESSIANLSSVLTRALGWTYRTQGGFSLFSRLYVHLTVVS